MNKPQNITEAQSHMANFISQEKEKILKKKSWGCQYMEYGEFVTLCNKIQVEYSRIMGIETSVKEVEAACCMAQAVIAPDLRTRLKVIKKAGGLLTGMAGVAAIISAIGMALGWGATVTTLVINFFIGVNFVPVIGWGVTGAGLLVIAGYFILHEENPFVISDKAEQALRKSITAAIEKTWHQ